MYRIVIAQRGWVFVGKYSREGAMGQEVVLSPAAVVRRWGSEAKSLMGLRDGPLADTVLDGAGTIRLHELTVVASIDVSDNWEGVLNGLRD